MTMVWIAVAAVAAVAAGVLLYRGGVHDGVRLCRQSVRREQKAAQRKASVVPDEQQQRMWQEIANFMQYDGSEMPAVKRGE